MKYRGYEIAGSRGHGKNTKGNKRTSTIQVHQSLRDGYILLKEFRFSAASISAQNEAVSKAKAHVDGLIEVANAN